MLKRFLLLMDANIKDLQEQKNVLHEEDIQHRISVWAVNYGCCPQDSLDHSTQYLPTERKLIKAIK